MLTIFNRAYLKNQHYLACPTSKRSNSFAIEPILVNFHFLTVLTLVFRFFCHYNNDSDYVSDYQIDSNFVVLRAQWADFDNF